MPLIIVKLIYKNKIQEQHQYSNYLIDSSFQLVFKCFVLSFENNTDRTVHGGYYLPKGCADSTSQGFIFQI